MGPALACHFLPPGLWGMQKTAAKDKDFRSLTVLKFASFKMLCWLLPLKVNINFSLLLTICKLFFIIIISSENTKSIAKE